MNILYRTNKTGNSGLRKVIFSYYNTDSICIIDVTVKNRFATTNQLFLFFKSSRNELEG